jgi:DNA-binding Xre family transcriptional regulator
MTLKNLKLKNRLLVLIHEKELREGKRVKQAEIARAIGVANHTIGSWIRNDVTKFEAHIIEGLCAYFECGVGDLLYLEEIDETQTS